MDMRKPAGSQDCRVNPSASILQGAGDRRTAPVAGTLQAAENNRTAPGVDTLQGAGDRCTASGADTLQAAEGQRTSGGTSPGPLHMQLVQALLQLRNQPQENNQPGVIIQKRPENPQQPQTQEPKTTQPSNISLSDFLQQVKDLSKTPQGPVPLNSAGDLPQGMTASISEAGKSISISETGSKNQSVFQAQSIAQNSYSAESAKNSEQQETHLLHFMRGNPGTRNLTWQELMEKVANVQKTPSASNTARCVKETNPLPIPKIDPVNRPSLTHELLELIRKSTANDTISEVGVKMSHKEKVTSIQELSNQNIYQTIDTAQIVEVSTAAEDSNSMPASQTASESYQLPGHNFKQLNMSYPSFATENQNVGNNNSASDQHSTQYQLSYAQSERPKYPKIQGSHNIEIEMKNPDNDSSQMKNDNVVQNVQKLGSPTSNTQFGHGNDERAYSRHPQIVSSHDSGNLHNDQFHIQPHMSLVQEIQPQQQPMAQFQFLQSNALADIPAQMSQGPEIVMLQNGMDGMRNLIGELRSEIIDLRRELEIKSQEDSVSKLTNMVEELKKENTFLKQHLRILVSQQKEQENLMENTRAEDQQSQQQIVQPAPAVFQQGQISDAADNEENPADLSDVPPETDSTENLPVAQKNEVIQLSAKQISPTDVELPNNSPPNTHLKKETRDEEKPDQNVHIPSIKSERESNEKLSKTSCKKGRSTLIHDEEGKICCTFCDKKFVHSSSFYYHIKKHTKDRPYKCSYCAKAFYNSTQLKGHVRIHTGEKPYPCTICARPFTEVSAMKKHLSTVHSDVKLHQCDKCDKAYKNARDLRNHIKKHDAPDGKPFECGLCNKRFVCERYAKICEKSHVNHTPFICVACGKNFKSAEILRMHEQIHGDKARHKCKLCGKLFRQQPSLYTHMKTHTRTNMLPCTLCGREFLTKYRLKNHLMRHNGERPRKCTLCNKGFVEAHELARHMRVHNDISPYACKYCDRTFKDNSNLKQHEKSHGLKKKANKTSNVTPSKQEVPKVIEAQGQCSTSQGQVVTVLEPFTSKEQQLLDSGQSINVQVIHCQDTSATSTQCIQDPPSHTGVHIENNTSNGEQVNSSNLVIMDSSSTSILDIDSYPTSE